MSVALAWLVSRLQNLVPAADSVPTTAQYEQACEDAVADLGRRKPQQKLVTLSIVSGTASYTLPSDFVRLVALEGVANESGVLVTGTGLIDFGSGFNEYTTVQGQTLSIEPTPTYTADRRLRYAAGHVLDDNGDFPDLTPDEARVALVKAQALAWEMRAAVIAATAYSYTIGDVSENHGPQLQALQAQITTLQNQYEAALKQLIGPVGRRNRGSVWNVRMGEMYEG